MELRTEQKQEMTLSEQVLWLFRESDTEFTRFISSVAMIGWCIILIQPGETFGTSAAFNGMKQAFWWSPLGSENTWAVIAGVVGSLIGLSALLHLHKLHAVALLFAAIFWFYIALSILFASPISTGTAGYGAIAIGAIWAFLRYMARHDVITRHDR